MSGKVYNEVITDKSLVIIGAVLIGISWLMIVAFGMAGRGNDNITYASLFPIAAAVFLWGVVVAIRKFRK